MSYVKKKDQTNEPALGISSKHFFRIVVPLSPLPPHVRLFSLVRVLWITNPVRYPLSQYDLVFEKGYFL